MHKEAEEGKEEPGLLLSGPLIITIAVLMHTVAVIFISLHMLLCCLGFKFFADEDREAAG